MNWSDAIRLIRPRQWTKNLAVFAAIIFSGKLWRPNRSSLQRLSSPTIVAMRALLERARQ